MSLRTYMRRIRRLDALIRRKSTGPPEELAERLGISERWLYKFLQELKEELDCPISYDQYQQSYVYEENGQIMVGFKELSKKEKHQVSGGSNQKISHCIYLFSESDLISNNKVRYNGFITNNFEIKIKKIMKEIDGLTPLKQSELKISGGHMADLRAGNDGLFTWHQVGDFFRGVYDGMTN